MASMGSSALWASRCRIGDLVDIARLIDDLFWDRLDLSVPHQAESNWCWAATSDGVVHFYDTSSTWTQCAIADSELGRTDCCGGGASGPCNVYGYLDQALSVVGHFDHMTSTVADFQTVDDEIDAHRPSAGTGRSPASISMSRIPGTVRQTSPTAHCRAAIRAAEPGRTPTGQSRERCPHSTRPGGSSPAREASAMPLRVMQPPDAVQQAAADHVHQLATPRGVFPALRDVVRE